MAVYSTNEDYFWLLGTNLEMMSPSMTVKMRDLFFDEKVKVDFAQTVSENLSAFDGVPEEQSTTSAEVYHLQHLALAQYLQSIRQKTGFYHRTGLHWKYTISE